MSTQQDERGGLPSASNLHRRYLCPGSEALEAQAPESTPDDVAQEGQDIHQALEDPEFVELDEHAASVAEHLKLMEKEAIADWMKHIGIAGHTEPIRELRLWITEKGKRIASAKPDLFVISRPHESFVCDFKSGYLPVTEARRSIQARIQAVALNDEYGPFKRIRAVMAAYRFRGNLTVCDYGPDDLKRAKEELRFNLWRSSLPDAPRIPGIDQCRYCRGKSFCREAAAYSLLPVPVARDEKDVVAAVAQLSPADLAFLHGKKSLAEKVFEAVDIRLRSLPREVLNEVGLDLGTPGSSREVTDIQKCWSLLFQQGMTEDEFRSACKVAIGKLETAMVPKIRSRRPEITSNEAAKKIVGKIIEPAVEHKSKSAPLIAYRKPLELPE